MINTTSTFYFRAVETQIRNHPYLFCITIKIFFPSIIASIGISLLLPSRSGKQQYAFISMVAAILSAIPTAINEHYPFLANKVFLKRSPYSQSTVSHGELIQTGIEPRVDIYKVVFMLTQMFVLLFFTLALIIKNRALKKVFAEKVKLEVLNLIKEEKGDQLEIVAEGDLNAKFGRKCNP